MNLRIHLLLTLTLRRFFRPSTITQFLRSIVAVWDTKDLADVMLNLFAERELLPLDAVVGCFVLGVTTVSRRIGFHSKELCR